MDSRMVFDYAVPLNAEAIHNYFGAREFIETWEKHRSNEPFQFSIKESRIDFS